MTHRHRWETVGIHSSSNGGAVCRVKKCYAKLNHGDVSNRLITHAELLEALQKLVERIDYNGGIGEYQGGPVFVMKHAREVIARATGKE